MRRTFLGITILILACLARAQTIQLPAGFTASASGVVTFPFGCNSVVPCPQTYLYFPSTIVTLGANITAVGTSTSWTAQIKQSATSSGPWTNCESAITITASSTGSGTCTPSGSSYMELVVTAGTGGGALNGTVYGNNSSGTAAVWGNITGTLSNQTDLENALNAKQASLSLLEGTYTDTDWCSYAASGTLLNCNNASPQVNLSLAKGTYSNGDLCGYTASGTLLNCNIAPGGAGTVTDGSGTTSTPEFAESTGTAHVLQYRTAAQALGDMGAATALANNTSETTSFNLASNTVFRFTGSGASNATTPASVTAGFIASIQNAGTAAVTVVSGGPTLHCEPFREFPPGCVVPIGGSASITTDANGTDFDEIGSNCGGSACGAIANLSTPGAAGYALYSGSSSWSTPHLTDNGTLVTSSEPLNLGSGVNTFLENNTSPLLFYPDADSTSLSLGVGANGSQTAVSQYDVAIGEDALGAATQAASGGLEDTAVGFWAMKANTTGYNNVAVGTYALDQNTTAFDNTAVGTDALAGANTGDYNTAVGEAALAANTSGYNNTAIGQQALFVATVTHDNTALGQNALYSLTGTGGNLNTALGSNAEATMTTGSANTAVGEDAMYTMTTATQNVAVGSSALYTSNSSYNTAIGQNALEAETSGNNNTAVGYESLETVTTNGGDTGVGSYSLNVATGSNLVAVGQGALQSLTTGSGDTAIGKSAGNNGTQNATTAANIILIGYNTGLAIATDSNEIVIGEGATGAGSNTTTLGNSSTTLTILAGSTQMVPQTVLCHLSTGGTPDAGCSPTAAQLSNAVLTNYGQGATNVAVTGPSLTAGMVFVITMETAQASNYFEYHSTGANIYLDGSASAVTNIIFAAPAVGNSFSCFVSPNAVFMKCTTLAGTSSSS